MKFKTVEPMEDLSQLQTKKVLEELFYALSGFETDLVHFADASETKTTVFVDESECALAVPFRPLVMEVRRAAMHPAFQHFVADYLAELSELRQTVHSAEELFVALTESSVLFEGIGRLIDAPGIDWEDALGPGARPSGRAALLAFLRPREGLDTGALGLRSETLRGFLEERARAALAECVEEWMNDANPTGLVEEKAVDGFASCMWRDMFRIKGRLLRGAERKAVEESGKIVYLIRSVFDTAVVAEAEGAEQGDALPPFRYGDDLAQRHTALLGLLSSFVLDDLKAEIALIYEIMFVRDSSFYLEILEAFGSDLLQTSQETVVKINAFIGDGRRGARLSRLSVSAPPVVSCRLSNVSLSQYVLRLLETRAVQAPDPFLPILHRLSIACASSLLPLFIPQKTFTEIKIISRFLFLVTAALFYIERSPRPAFLQIIHILLLKIRDAGHLTPGDASSPQAAVDTLLADTSRLLDRYSLTSAGVFLHWARLFDIALAYVQTDYKAGIDTAQCLARTEETVQALGTAMRAAVGDNAITEFIDTLQWAHYAER